MRKQRKNSKWCGREAAYVLDMAADGVSTERMAARLRRSKGAVASKLRAWNLFVEAQSL